ncbi:MAG: hypothetical protein ACI915_004202 [Gammaproteobacteria bacterium]|jgi:hypothetical protein
MLNVTHILTMEVVDRIDAAFECMFGSSERIYVQHAKDAAAATLAQIATSDALYHNVEHTVHVTVVGIEILKARHLEAKNVTRKDWLNVIIALLCHDIGYVRGICASDDGERLSNGIGNQSTRIAIRRSDAALMPIHVNRSKCYVEEQFGQLALADIPLVQSCIERTRFPVPIDPSYALTGDYPGLVRGADLIGQLSDLRYLNKLSAIFYEFEEVGFNEGMGYGSPGDLLEAYPLFFEQSVHPYIVESVRLLETTVDGREIVVHLYANLDDAR